jgi:hypothetical protein
MFHGFAFTSTGGDTRRPCDISNSLLDSKDLRARLRTLETVASVCLLDWGVRLREYVGKRGWDINDHETASIQRALHRSKKVADRLGKELERARKRPAGTFLESDLTRLQGVLSDLRDHQHIWKEVVGTDSTGTTPVPFAGYGDS